MEHGDLSSVFWVGKILQDTRSEKRNFLTWPLWKQSQELDSHFLLFSPILTVFKIFI